jgi:hypothetical protein
MQQHSDPFREIANRLRGEDGVVCCTSVLKCFRFSSAMMRFAAAPHCTTRIVLSSDHLAAEVGQDLDDVLLLVAVGILAQQHSPHPAPAVHDLPALPDDPYQAGPPKSLSMSLLADLAPLGLPASPGLVSFPGDLNPGVAGVERTPH